MLGYEATVPVHKPTGPPQTWADTPRGPTDEDAENMPLESQKTLVFFTKNSITPLSDPLLKKKAE